MKKEGADHQSNSALVKPAWQSYYPPVRNNDTVCASLQLVYFLLYFFHDVVYIVFVYY